MRPKAGLDIEAAITELGVGEALVSLLDAKGRPSVTERVFVLPPGSRIGPVSEAERQALIAGSLVAGVYEKQLDRQSAYEMLKGHVAGAAPAPSGGGNMANEAGGVFNKPAPGAANPAPAEGNSMMDGLKDVLFGSTGPRGGRREGLAEAAAKSAIRTIGSSVGREIVRGVLGSLLGGAKRRR